MLSLEDVCLECVVSNLDDVFSTVEAAKGFYYEFKDPECHLHADLAEKLLIKLDENELVNDSTLPLFNNQNTTLHKIYLKNLKASTEALKVLESHRINELHITNARHKSLSEILDCLNEFSLSGIQCLNVSKCSFRNTSLELQVFQLMMLSNLRYLNVSFTEFDQRMLWLVSEGLPKLEKLDVSATFVTSLEPLLLMKERLTCLIASDIKLGVEAKEVFRGLDRLQHLDVSLENERYDNLLFNIIDEILNDPAQMPNLVHMDVSFWKVKSPTLETFLRCHPRLKYLGAVMSPAASDPALIELLGAMGVIVGGLGTPEQIAVALQRYRSRVGYVERAFHSVMELNGAMTGDECRTVAGLVADAMNEHRRRFQLQYAGVNCIRELTRVSVTEHTDVALLLKATDSVLNAMSFYSGFMEMQDAGLQFFYNEWLINNVPFSKLRCAVQAMECFARFNDSLDCNSIVIIDALLRIMNDEERKLFSDEMSYMMKYTTTIKERIHSEDCDLVLMVTVSILTVVTDLNPISSNLFIETNGLQHIFNLLTTFYQMKHFTRSVLLLTNNLVELPSTHVHFLKHPQLLTFITNQVTEIDVYLAYFLGGIVAHLSVCKDWDEKEEGLEALRCAMLTWDNSVNLFVSYNTFKPFFGLLTIGVDWRAQQWALWAIRHMFDKDPKQYGDLLKEEGAVQILQKFAGDSKCNKAVKLQCQSLIDTFDF